MFTLQHTLPTLEEGILSQISIKDLAGLLHNCAKEKDRARGLLLYAHLRTHGMETHKSLGNYLVSMLVAIGSIQDAQSVFERLAHKSKWSWNSLITGYINCGQPHHAFTLFEKMQLDDSVQPNCLTFWTLLKACSVCKNLTRGLDIHVEVARMGLLESFSSALIDMHSKCGSIAKAQEVFDKVCARNLAIWNALMGAYATHGHGDEVLNCFEQMQLEGFYPDGVAFIHILKACGSIGDIRKGQEIHAEIERQGSLRNNVFVGSTMVDMYAKFGLVAKAQDVFDKLSTRNVVSWTALIAGYAEHGHGKEALKCFEQMQGEGISPNSVTFACSLKACGSVGDIERGKKIHEQVEKKGLVKGDLVVGNTLVDMYVKCGSLAKAREVFDKLQARNVVSWTALISGYAENGHNEEALKCFEQMQDEGVAPNAITFACSLKACGNLGATDKALELHIEIERMGLLERHLVVGNTLVDAYAKLGWLSKAQQVFDKLTSRDIVTWNSLIAGYAEQGQGEEVIKYSTLMQCDGITPDAVTFVCMLKACGNMGAPDKGQDIHAEVEEKGLLGNHFVGSTLVDMYAKCGLLEKAQEVFDKLPSQKLVSWNALITGYANQGLCDEAIRCFEQMQLKGFSPDAITFVCSLRACSGLGAMDKGLEIHTEIARMGLLERDLVVGSTLVDMYVKCGWLSLAQQVFDNLSVRDAVLWNALIAGYADHGYGEKALKVFEKMQVEGIPRDASSFVCGLKACGSLGATDKGQEIHMELARKGLLGRDLVVDNTLVDMYAKCGALAVAQQLFDNLPVRDVISWNSLIAGYAQMGDSENVLLVFDRMLGDGVKPDPITFVIVLTACSRAGRSDISQTYFEAMSKDYGIAPTLEHHTSIVDLFGRVGQLDKAVALAKGLPVSPNLVTWHAVLGACKNGGNVELGKQVFEHAVCMDNKDAAAYVLLSHIQAGAGLHKETDNFEALGMSNHVEVIPAQQHLFGDTTSVVKPCRNKISTHSEKKVVDGNPEKFYCDSRFERSCHEGGMEHISDFCWIMACKARERERERERASYNNVF